MTQGKGFSRRSVVKGAAGVAGAAAFAGTGLRRSRAQSSNVEIDFMHIWGTPPGEQAAAQKHPAELLIDAFNAKNTGVTVKSRVDSTDYFETLQKAQAEMAAGNPPALVATPWSNIYYASEGLGITNLEDVAAAAGADVTTLLGNLKPEVVSLVQLDGATKGVPFAFSTPVIYYNVDALTAAGVDPAQLWADWDAFAQLGPTLKDANNGNPLIAVGTNYDWPAQSLIQSNGGRVLNDEQQPAMDSPEAVAALQTIAGLAEAGLWQNGTAKDNRASFVSGAIPAFMASIAGLGGLTNEVTFSLATTPFPVYPGKPRQMSSGGSFIGCYAKETEQQAAAWQFLNFAVSQEGTEIWMKTGYLNATNFEVAVLPNQEAAYTQLGEGLSRETAWPGSRGGEIQKIWGTYVERIWANDISAEDGTKEAKQEIEGMIS